MARLINTKTLVMEPGHVAGMVQVRGYVDGDVRSFWLATCAGGVIAQHVIDCCQRTPYVSVPGLDEWS